MNRLSRPWNYVRRLAATRKRRPAIACSNVEQHTAFAIIFVGRQGSSYLEGLLDSHPDAQCQGELLNSGPDPLAREGYSTVEAYLLDRVYAGPESACGFKMPWMAFEKYPVTWKVLDKLGYSLIYLTRENKLDQYISAHLASLNDVWRSDRGDYHRMTFRADLAEAKAWFSGMEFKEAMLEQAIRGFPHLCMTYESLTQPEGYLPVLDFLGLERLSLSSPYHKQRHGRQCDIIENYAEMKTAFADSPWMNCFVD